MRYQDDYDDESGIVAIKCSYCNGFNDFEIRHGILYASRCGHCGEIE